MPQNRRDVFLNAVANSRLLTSEQIAELPSLPGNTPEEAAYQLMQRQWLTEWQAYRIMSGETRFFLGKYRILKELGRGGMGAVFQAREELGLGRIVAIKIMAMKLLHNQESVRRFLREAKAVAVLNHPHIVAAFDADCINGRHFLVMEHVEGRDLSAWLQRFEKLPVAWVCECIRQAALGLQHAHERGLVHRDIKPGNLLVLTDEPTTLPRLKILDFGLARFTSGHDLSALTQTGQVMGTVDYMSPEQASSTKTVDIRSDIFSLGCTFFKLLTGQVPFSGDTTMERLFARAKIDAPPLRSHLPEASAELESLVSLMLARSRKRRFQTPGEVAQALAPFSLSRLPELISEQSLRWPVPPSQAVSDNSLSASESRPPLAGQSGPTPNRVLHAEAPAAKESDESALVRNLEAESEVTDFLQRLENDPTEFNRLPAHAQAGSAAGAGAAAGEGKIELVTHEARSEHRPLNPLERRAHDPTITSGKPVDLATRPRRQGPQSHEHDTPADPETPVLSRNNVSRRGWPSFQSFLPRKSPPGSMLRSLRNRRLRTHWFMSLGLAILGLVFAGVFLANFASRSEQGRLELIVDQANVDVMIDGWERGPTGPSGKSNLYPLPAGEHEIILRKDGFTAVRWKALIGPEETTRRRFTLAPSTTIAPEDEPLLPAQGTAKDRT